MFFPSALTILSPAPFLLRLLGLAAVMIVTAGAGALAQEPVGSAPVFPVDYGEIVYRVNARAPQQIYIIGQCHRSAVSDRVRPETVKVQAEIYRIGEWLIREQNVTLLLPEGFFQKAPAVDVERSAAAQSPVRLDSQALESRLGDTRRFVNADLLLNDSYDIRLGQVENERLYRDIRRLLAQAGQNNSLSLLARLADLQNERTAAMLQNIPDIVDEAFRSGRIANRRAMFTIGLAHLGQIIHALQRNAHQDETNTPSLTLLERGYGVTVIIPRTLADNELALRIARRESH